MQESIAEWFIQLGSGFSRMQLIEEAISSHQSIVEYKCWGTRYLIDLNQMKQINMNTSYERRILRLEHADSHLQLSPFHGAACAA